MTNTGMTLDGGFLQPVPPNAPLNVQNIALNDVINRLNSLLKTQVFSDGTSKRMLIGFQENGWGAGKSFGIKISQEGVDVMKASDDELLFKMDLETWDWYDATAGTNPIRIGKMPDGSYDIVVSPPGSNVDDAF